MFCGNWQASKMSIEMKKTQVIQDLLEEEGEEEEERRKLHSVNKNE